MGQFGQQLREERESRGIALENITGVTKISGRHLLALEDENFDALPGGVLSKGIVRGYARVVGLDEDAWVDRYLAAYNHSGQLKDDDVSWMEFAENVGRSRKGEAYRRSQGGRWAGVAVLLTLLVLFGWYVTHFVNTRAALASEDLRPHVASLPVPAEAPLAPPHHLRRTPLPALVEPAADDSIEDTATASNPALTTAVPELAPVQPAVTSTALGEAPQPESTLPAAAAGVASQPN